MFCIKCGSKNSEEAIFCLKCGNKFEDQDEQETRVSTRRSDRSETEREIFSIRPTLLFVKIGYGVAVAGAFFVVAFLSFLSQLIGYPISAWVSILIGLSLLLVPTFYHLKQKTILYTLTDSKVTIDHGLISKTTRNVPLRIIQDVTVSATFIQRLLGFGDVEIENANEGDGKVLLKNINSPKTTAEKLMNQMRLLDK